MLKKSLVIYALIFSLLGSVAEAKKTTETQEEQINTYELLNIIKLFDHYFLRIKLLIFL